MSEFEKDWKISMNISFSLSNGPASEFLVNVSPSLLIKNSKEGPKTPQLK